MSLDTNLKPQGLFSSLRLSLFYALLFILGYLGLFVVADYMIRDSIADNEREIIAERLSEYRVWFNRGQLQELRSRFEEQSLRSGDLIFVRISGNGLNSFLFSGPRGQSLIDEAPLEKLAESRRSVVATINTEDPAHVWTVASSPVGDGYLIQAGRISTEAFRPADRFRKLFLRAMIPVSLFAIIGGWMMSFHAMKPVRDLTATAADIVKTGNLDQRVKVENQHGDLARMGILFNRMLDQNQMLIRSMKESLDNTAHDLRTPMARMRAIAETALAADDKDAATEALSDCMEESDRVLKMLNTLMDISEAETGVMQLSPVVVNLAEMVDQVAEIYELVSEDRDVTIKNQIDHEIEVMADRSRLQQVIANLVDNAIKYSEPGGRIEIDAEANEAETALHISDEGIGISPEALPKIWERLYRADQSRSKRGLGLGLSFVKAIVDAHGGRVEVKSEIGAGSRFSIYLPGHGSR